MLMCSSVSDTHIETQKKRERVNLAWILYSLNDLQSSFLAFLCQLQPLPFLLYRFIDDKAFIISTYVVTYKLHTRLVVGSCYHE